VTHWYLTGIQLELNWYSSAGWFIDRQMALAVLFNDEFDKQDYLI